jgi:GNAT superfamily N-acetyltransferase
VQNVEIRRPRIDDLEGLHHFFRIVITDTFAKEGLTDLLDEIEKEIEDKIKNLHTYFESNGESRYFFMALVNDQVIGTIEYGPASKLINDCTDGELKELVEVGTVFVRPDYQRQGIGNLLLNVMYLTLQNKGIDEFCLDSGYTNAQKIWKKKFGEPDYLFEDFWGEGYDHMIWRRRINDIPIMFRI